jgi:tRNA(Glu) U13 pseudouridine synthase TruD
MWKLAASAAQSAVFNAVLAGREQAGILHQFLVGDVGHTVRGAPFTVTVSDLAETNRRAAPGILDAFTTGPLPGESRLRPAPDRDAQERAWAQSTGIDWSCFDHGGELRSPGERRNLVVPLRAEPSIETDGDITWINLSLTPGSYATEALSQIGIELPTDRRGDG